MWAIPQLSRRMLTVARTSPVTSSWRPASAGSFDCKWARRPYASARLRSVAVEAAAAADGVALVLTGADVAQPPAQRVAQGGSELASAPAPALVREIVKAVGAPIAAVVASTPEQALAAVELI